MTDAARRHSAATLYEASAPAGRACDADVRAIWPGARVAGPAFTVRGVGGDNLALHRAVYAAATGSVLVADVQAAAHGHWGEVLAVAAQQRGLLGLVLDGGVRDVAELAALGFPVFARHVSVRGTGKDHPGQPRAGTRRRGRRRARRPGRRRRRRHSGDPCGRRGPHVGASRRARRRRAERARRAARRATTLDLYGLRAEADSEEPRR
jgi:Aldolase/RraA